MLEVAVWPAPILEKRMDPIVVFDKELEFLAEQMFETMYSERGIGLAAPQVNLSKCMLVMDCGGNPLAMVNPVFGIAHEDRDNKTKTSEGCLSFPGFLVDVERWKRGTVHYQPIDGGNRIVKEVEGLESVCVQHEIDHLNGITFLRYISKQHRELIQKKLRKQKRGY